MAITTATITVDFTSNYAGPHRVCWRVQGSGDPYDCTTTVNCTGGATACQAIINADVNTTSCDGVVTFEGYVQAACEDILSTNGRLLWTVDFTPTIACQRYQVSCDSLVVDSLTLTSGGGGYSFGSPPAVSFSAPETIGGTFPTAVTTVSKDAVSGVSFITPGGSGYIDGVYVDHPTVTSGSGTGFLMSFTVVGGIIVSVEGTNSVGSGGEGGIGYALTDTVNPDPAGPAGTPTVPFTITVTGISDGEVTTITLTDPGSGYTAAPTVTIGAGAPTATATATLATECPLFDIGNDCIGGDLVCLTNGLPLGESFATCIQVGTELPVATGYNVSASGCCIPDDTTGDPCVFYEIDNQSGGAVDIHYTACEGDNTILNVLDGSTVNVCAVEGGVVIPILVGLTITNTGTPCS